jgi:hypothetical protein
MKFRNIILILVIFSFISCNEKEKQIEIIDKKVTESNVEKDDTLKIKESKPKVIIPKGTQIFHNSEKLYGLKWANGYILKSIEISECDDSVDSEEDYNKDKSIQSIIINDESFTIKFKAVENCCSEFLCEAELNNETLNIIYHSFSSHCFCDCIFDMSYTFNFSTSFEEIDEERTKIKNIILNGDSESKTKFK